MYKKGYYIRTYGEHKGEKVWGRIIPAKDLQNLGLIAYSGRIWAYWDGHNTPTHAAEKDVTVVDGPTYKRNLPDWW